MRKMISNSFLHPYTVIDMLAGVWDGSIINVLVEVLITDVSAGAVVRMMSDAMVSVDIDILVGVETTAVASVIVAL